MSEKNEINHISDKQALNLAIVGGGRVCKFFIEFLKSEPLPYLDIKIVGVCDINSEAEGFRLAGELGIHTTNDFRELFKLKDLDGVIELTNSRDVLLELIRLRPKGLGILEHNIGRFLRKLMIAEQKLEDAKQQVTLEKLASDFLMQQANERIVVLKSDFTIVEANEAYLQAVNKPKEEVIGAHCYEITHNLSAPCASSHPELGCPLIDTLRTGESAQVIHDHHIDGQSIYCDMVTYPVKNRSGQILRIIEVWRDITQELTSHWEKKVKQLKEDLNRLVIEDRMISLGKLVASSVHEINNPIQGLLTYSRLMETILSKGDPSSEELKKFRKYLPIMSNELERCGNIVSGLLSFSRKPAQEFKIVDLNEILEAALVLTRHKMEIQGIRLSTDLSSKPLMLHADTNQIQQCFLNVIFNAIEAMPEGGELAIISRHDHVLEKALIEFSDTGCGISAENLDHIFYPFFTTKEEGEGTGLGLSIVYGIIKAHGGDVKVKSIVGKGSAFTMLFPIP